MSIREELDIGRELLRAYEDAGRLSGPGRNDSLKRMEYWLYANRNDLLTLADFAYRIAASNDMGEVRALKMDLENILIRAGETLPDARDE